MEVWLRRIQRWIGADGTEYKVSWRDPSFDKLTQEEKLKLPETGEKYQSKYGRVKKYKEER